MGIKMEPSQQTVDAETLEPGDAFETLHGREVFLVTDHFSCEDDDGGVESDRENRMA